MGRTQSEKRMDLEADYFARALLIPEHMLQQSIDELNKNTSTEKAVKELSKTYQVSEVQMTLRLRELKII